MIEMTLEILVCMSVGFALILLGEASTRLWYKDSKSSTMLFAAPFVFGVTLVAFAIFIWLCDTYL